MKTKKGQILLITVMVLATILTVVMAITFKSTSESRTTALETESQKALAAAEAANESALQTNQNVTIGEGQLSTFTGISGSATVQPVITNMFITPLIGKDSSYTFYLADYDPDQKRFTGTSTNEPVTVCFDKGNEIPAIEITLLKTNSVKKYVIDPGINNIGERFDNTYPSAGVCPANSSFDYSYTIPGSEIINDSKVLVVRVIFNTSKLIFTRSSNFPVQGRTAVSDVKTESGVSKKVTLFQSYPQIPIEFFTTNFPGSSVFPTSAP